MKFFLRREIRLFTPWGARAKKRRKDIFTIVRFSPLRVAALKVKKDKRGCGNYIGLFMLKKGKNTAEDPLLWRAEKTLCRKLAVFCGKILFFIDNRVKYG